MEPGTDARGSALGRFRRVDPVNESMVRVGSFRTRALQTTGDGPLLILLHGFADSADTWRPVLSRLAAEGRPAVALDLPGFALAAPLAEDEPVLAQLAAFTAAAVHAYADDRECVLVGTALGGTAALLAAADQVPVERVVALAPAGFDMASWIFRLETFALLRTVLRLPPVAPGIVMETIVERIYRQLAVHDQRQVGHDVVRQFTRHLRDRATVMRYLHLADRLTPELAAPLELGDVDIPVDLVWGRQDGMLPYANAALALQALPTASLTTLEGCGHCPQVECSDLIADMLLRQELHALLG